MKTGPHRKSLKAIKNTGLLPGSGAGLSGKNSVPGKRVVIGTLLSVLIWTGCWDPLFDADHCTKVPQEVHGYKILAIGDSITAYWSKNSPFECCQSYPDFASIEINEHIQNEAVSGTRLSGEGPTIPQQYTNAKASNGAYDLVILTGGANDLHKECDLEEGQTCSVTCGEKLLEIADEMETLVTDIVRDGSDVVIVGYYQMNELALSPGENIGLAAYNECLATIIPMYQKIADSSPHVSLIETADLVDPHDAADYFADGLHPSIAAAQRIGHRLASVLETR